MRLSQSHVCKCTKISQDCLRKIENGYVMPRFDTLMYLSSVYRTNLFPYLAEYCIVLDLDQLDKKVTKLIDNQMLDEIVDVTKELESKKDSLISNDILQIEEYEQFKLFCEASILFLKNEKPLLEEGKSKILKAIQLTLSSFDFTCFKAYQYSNFEIRLLHLYALTEKRLGNFDSSLKILLFLMDHYRLDSKDQESIRTMVLIYFSTAYSYFEINDHVSTLNYANLGIEFSNKHDRMNELYTLYYRKGIAEFFLKNENYLDSLRKSVLLLEVQNNYSLAKMYRDITLSKYNIKID